MDFTYCRLHFLTMMHPSREKTKRDVTQNFVLWCVCLDKWRSNVLFVHDSIVHAYHGVDSLY